jgi:hypothetical protein
MNKNNFDLYYRLIVHTLVGTLSPSPPPWSVKALKNPALTELTDYT